MFIFPETEKKLKSRIATYNRKMLNEKKTHGLIHDGYGKRFLLFSFYFVLGNLEKSMQYFEWYKSEFPEDEGEPVQNICWALSLFRMGSLSEAKHKLAELMVSNLYFIPHILNQPVVKHDIIHDSNFADLDYVRYIPEEVLEVITKSEINWIEELHDSNEFSTIRERFILIGHELLNPVDKIRRQELLKESKSILDNLN